MFCVDCGRESKKTDRYCPSCGYPLELLEKRIVKEKEESIGWVERILTKSDEIEKPVKEPVIESLPSTEVFTEDLIAEKRPILCESCGEEVGYGTICPKCGDRLPFISINDSFISSVLHGFASIIFSPRQFAIGLPYPFSGGTMAPLVYPGIFASIFIISLPLTLIDSNRNFVIGLGDLAPLFILFPVYLFVSPILVYLSIGLAHAMGIILGGHVAFRRTLRVGSAALIWTFIIGAIANLLSFVTRWVIFQFHGFFGSSSIIILADKIHRDHPWIFSMPIIVFLAWMYAWWFGGLFRLNWWKAVLHLILSFWIVIIIWAYSAVIFPLTIYKLLER
ncbi:MAG: hypothetical protein ABIC40_01170 [bacterium]